MTPLNVARIEAAIAEHPPAKAITFGPLQLDRDTGVITGDGVALKQLTGMRAKLLAALMLAPKHFLSHHAAFDALYWDRGESSEPDPKMVVVYSCFLRRDVKRFGIAVRNIRDKGYQLEIIAP